MAQAEELSPESLEILKQLRGDFEYYAPRCLKIRTKSGDTQAFNLNRSQRFLHERLEDQRARTGKVRALVLKGRQVGISTYISGRYYWKTSLNHGLQAFILTHRDDATSNLFTMAKGFHDSAPPVIQPATRAANAKELSFSELGSGYKVGTAGGVEIGRSSTIQLFHGSEMAFWPNADMHAAGIVQAIADEPGTEDIRESTANGIGNAFHKLCKAAQLGESEYELIFIPWFWHEAYVKTPPSGWTPPTDWQDYANAHGLTKDQLYWAYTKSRDLSAVTGEDPAQISWKFRQEYPATAEEAFQNSGVESLIRPEKVLAARKADVTPYGPIILGVDPARGGGDKTGVVDRQGRRMGANICERLDISDLMELAGHIQRIAKDISADKVVIDTTGLGAGVYDRLKELLDADVVEGVNFSSKAYDHAKYANRRAEMWDEMRQWFEDKAGVQIPDDDKVQGDLCAVPAPGNLPNSTRFDSSGRLILEAKEKIRDRLSFSPDLGDAAALTFAADFTNVTEDFDDLGLGVSHLEGGWLAA